MQESQFYRYLQEKFARETTIENTLTLLEAKFPPDAVSALRPALLKITDLQRLKKIFRAAARAPNVEAFVEILYEE